ncbi:MAG: DMT family transporter, partial [Christensenellaceae bacterium]|nr:DMT family transporter [Christensenellaceae bacterium]
LDLRDNSVDIEVITPSALKNTSEREAKARTNYEATSEFLQRVNAAKNNVTASLKNSESGIFKAPVFASGLTAKTLFNKYFTAGGVRSKVNWTHPTPLQVARGLTYQLRIRFEINHAIADHLSPEEKNGRVREYPTIIKYLEVRYNDIAKVTQNIKAFLSAITAILNAEDKAISNHLAKLKNETLEGPERYKKVDVAELFAQSIINACDGVKVKLRKEISDIYNNYTVKSVDKLVSATDLLYSDSDKDGLNKDTLQAVSQVLKSSYGEYAKEIKSGKPLEELIELCAPEIERSLDVICERAKKLTDGQFGEAAARNGILNDLKEVLSFKRACALLQAALAVNTTDLTDAIQSVYAYLAELIGQEFTLTANYATTMSRLFQAELDDAKHCLCDKPTELFLSPFNAELQTEKRVRPVITTSFFAAMLVFLPLFVFALFKEGAELSDYLPWLILAGISILGFGISLVMRNKFLCLYHTNADNNTALKKKTEIVKSKLVTKSDEYAANNFAHLLSLIKEAQLQGLKFEYPQRNALEAKMQNRGQSQKQVISDSDKAFRPHLDIGDKPLPF